MREPNGLPHAMSHSTMSAGAVSSDIVPPGSAVPGTTIPASPAILQSLATIHDFVNSFTPKDMEQYCWELLYAAFNSSYADSWSSDERSAMLYFYRHLSQLAPALGVMDKECYGKLVMPEYDQA